MQITPLKDLPDRPEPLFDNTTENGTDFSKKRRLIQPVAFHEMMTFGRRGMQFSLQPTASSTAQHIPSLHIGDERAKIVIWNTDTGNHNIGMKVGDVRVWVMEHILGVLQGMNISTDIVVRPSPSVFDMMPSGPAVSSLFRYPSFPTKADCAQDYIDALTPDVLEKSEPSAVFTVKEPTRIDFGNKRGSYIVLLPDEGRHELIVDLMVSHSSKAVGTQRIKCKITDDVMHRYIAGARTPSYGIRRKCMKILDIFPFCQQFVNIDSSRTCAFDEKRFLNPREEYMVNGVNLELTMHEVLDKLGAFGIPIVGGKKFVGTIMTFASSHNDDTKVMWAMNDCEIAIEELEK